MPIASRPYEKPTRIFHPAIAETTSAVSSPGSQTLVSGGGVLAAAVGSTSDEKSAESTLVAAQDIWGLGNLSPLDHLFGSTAIMKLVPKLSLGFIGRHLGRRMHRYAEDTGIWIDAFETELALSRLHRKKSSNIRLNKWNKDATLLKKNRYAALVVVEPSQVCPSLEVVYGQCTSGLKLEGRILVADLMRSGMHRSIRGPAGGDLHSFDEHKNALASVGLTIEEEHDLTDNLMAAIRSGFCETLKMLRQLSMPDRRERQVAYCDQLEVWGTLYALAQKRVIHAAGFLATKQSSSAVKK